LPRTLNTQEDKRVLFRPDLWQKELLDIVDNRESALVCCPTSSGKTFISYYAMEQSLRASNDDVVVFVSPMKSLANQVAAEVYARFGSKVNLLK
jgi:superfamily II RNA helicase